MKIRMNKLVATLLAIALVFGAVSVMAGAANTDPYVKVSSISNVAVGSKAQTVTVSLSSDTELKNASIVLSYTDKDALKDTSITTASGVSGDFSVKDGEIILKVTSADNKDAAKDMTLFTIKFDFAADAKGLIELTATAGKVIDGEDATIAGKPFGVTNIRGEEAADVYNDFVGIGLNTADKKYIKSAGKAAPIANAKVVVTLKPYEGSAMKAVDPVEIPITDAICGTAVMAKDKLADFLDKNADVITSAIQAVEGNKGITYDAFDIVASSIVVPSSTTKYEEGKEYVWSVTLQQLNATTATIKLVFRPAFSDTTLYHSSDIPDYDGMQIVAYVGKTVKSQAEILSFVKTYAPTIDQYIKAESADKYGIDDFVLDETVVGFNNAIMTGKETFSADPAQNVYTVYFDQVNVPATVLGTAAQAFGKIDYAQIVKAQVFAINETIDAFQAFVDSLVNAEWPTADDVKADKTDDSKSPSTGSSVSLGFALASVVALASAAVVAVKRKDD